MTAWVVRRPHWWRRGEALSWVGDDAPIYRLAHAEVPLFDAVSAAPRPAAALPAALVERWHRDGVVERIEARASPPPGAPRTLVLEPHADDAALSVGARIAARSKAESITVLTVAPRSSYTRWGARLDAAATTRLRLEEAALAARVLGTAHASLALDEATLRFAEPSAWAGAHHARTWAAFTAYFDAPPFAEEVRAWAAHLDAAIARHAPDALWIPLAAGDHVDHRLVRDAALIAALARPALEVLLYEDLPYATEDAGAAPRALAALAEAGVGTAPLEATDDSTRSAAADAAQIAAWATKARAVSVFASQDEGPRFSAAIAARGGDERAHRVTRRAMPPSARPDPWLLARARLRVVALGPFARPREELARLERAFPGAALEVVCDPSWAWQLGARAWTPATDATVALVDPDTVVVLSARCPSPLGPAHAARARAVGGLVVDALVDAVAGLEAGAQVTAPTRCGGMRACVPP